MVPYSLILTCLSNPVHPTEHSNIEKDIVYVC